MVLFGKDDVAFGSKIVIFFFKLIGESHSANFVKLIDLLNDIEFKSGTSSSKISGVSAEVTIRR